jgi:hypothetical protein
MSFRHLKIDDKVISIAQGRRQERIGPPQLAALSSSFLVLAAFNPLWLDLNFGVAGFG